MTLVAAPILESAQSPPPLSNGAGHASPGGGNGAAERDAPFMLTPREKLPPIRKHSPETVERARKLYEATTKPITRIAEELGIGQSTIATWARKLGWTRPAGAPRLVGPRTMPTEQATAEQLRRRMHRALGRQLVKLEQRIEKAGGESAEKDARTLGLLARTLETLMQLDRNDGAKVTKPEPRDRASIHDSLARRIAAWAAEDEEPAQPSPVPS